MTIARPFVLAALALLIAYARPAAAQVPPDIAYTTLTSEHFRLTYAPGLDSLAWRAIVRAEAAHAILAGRLGRTPGGRIDIVLADNQDITNGTASPFPSNRILLWARPSVGVEGLDFYTEWLDLVLVHELTHIFHLDVAGALGRAMRSVFGRLPLLWPMFPAVGSPRWATEGLAVVVESELTGMGRIHGSYHGMVVRTDALEGGLTSFARVNGVSPIWPAGQRPYIYGSLFMDRLRERHGDDLGARLLDATATAVLPPLLFFDRVAQRTFGRSWDRAYADWRARVEEEAGIMADSLARAGLTLGERLTTAGWQAAHPRVSPDGSRLAYAAQDGRNTTATRVLELPATTPLGPRDEPAAEVRRNTIGTTSWLPDGGSFVVPQLEFDGPYRIVYDLWQVWPDGRSERLTRGRRLEDADVAPDGDRIIAVENGGGTNRLVIVHRPTGGVYPIADFDPGVSWDLPRWSPDGTRIAVARWEGGLQDIVVLGADGAPLVRLTTDRAVDAAPAWSPDGRWLLFSSDRTGITNLYAADLSAGPTRLRKVTSVLTGAFQPDVSPDGAWIHYVEYHEDGYHIARMPFEPASWRAAPPPIAGYGADHPISGARMEPTPGGAAPRTQEATIEGPAPYSPWPTLMPKFWSPLYYDSGLAGWLVGAATSGEDLVGRHAFTAFAAVRPSSGLWEGRLRWNWAGLGNPTVSFEVARDHDFAGRVQLPDSTLRDVLARETTAALSARFVRRRWRSSTSLTLGIEAESEHRTILEAPGFELVDRSDDMIGAVVRAGFANTRQHPFSISAEDGVALSAGTRLRAEVGDGDDHDASYTELSTWNAAYRSLDLPGFARHVVAARVSALLRVGAGARTTSIGGGSGTTIDALGFPLGESRLLPVRGFRSGDLFGTRAWTASLEYRFPLALVGERPRWSPLFLDRVSGAAFIDAGDAWCSDAQRELRPFCPSASVEPMVAAGGELVLDTGVSFLLATRLRIGVAAPLQGPRSGVTAYLSIGSSF